MWPVYAAAIEAHFGAHLGEGDAEQLARLLLVRPEAAGRREPESTNSDGDCSSRRLAARRCTPHFMATLQIIQQNEGERPALRRFIIEREIRVGASASSAGAAAIQ
jgi:hypothetical protein